eukprot:TRINITY_DN81834_c0_g1_i1.p2 TRINITY_DN81834_c0_g1~~TRINITY_DN81834_c0_g1_i1.p2  ORF type:complete len:248 (-),score=52.04 TRINITY_DN81834_c0_g1_i1:208-951(-)
MCAFLDKSSPMAEKSEFPPTPAAAAGIPGTPLPSKKRKGGTSSGANAHSGTTATDNAGGNARLNKAEMKALLQATKENSVRTRALAATVWITFLIPNQDKMKHLCDELTSSGRLYHSRTKGQRGHNQGTPAVWIWAGMVRALLTIAEKEDKSAWPEPSVKAILCLSNHFGGMKEPQDYTAMVLHCHARPTYQDSGMSVQLCISDKTLQEAVTIVLGQLGIKAQTGAAPPSAAERKIISMLSKLGGGD